MFTCKSIQSLDHLSTVLYEKYSGKDDGKTNWKIQVPFIPELVTMNNPLGLLSCLNLVVYVYIIVVHVNIKVIF